MVITPVFAYKVMSDIIQLLPDSVANQIAAGEVIQRPASVVKELVENAIDAGAANITLAVVDAGRTSIQVIDDGKGMSDTDARLSFERHSTSKIRKAEDLFALTTMGFRGEALASIAAVAQVELRTKPTGRQLGTLVRIAGSKVLGQEPVSCPSGSNFKVDNLFYNVPARRKFLKTNNTELSNILTAYERIALVYPEIGFCLKSNGAQLSDLRPGSLLQRIVDVCGDRLRQELLPMEVETAMCKIKVFVGKPESARRKGAPEYLFVNGRFMKHAYFHKAIASAYERLVPVGMHVPYFVYFDVSPEDIDVNIHPTKTEIKFENEQAIWQILAAAVRDAIGKFCEVSTIDFDTEGKPEIPIFDPSKCSPPKTNVNPSYNPFREYRKEKPVDGWESLYSGLTEEEEPKGGEPESQGISEELSPTHYQYKGKYIMTAVKSGLMIIDQRRADIRIRYERYMSKLAAQKPDTQRIMFPEIINLSASESVVAEKIRPNLEEMGFEITFLGQGSYSVNGVPAGFEGLNPAELITDLIAEAASNGNISSEQIDKNIALGMARNSAVTYGELLGNQEMDNIVNSLFQCSNVNYTPDGKAILCILPQGDIEQLMGS